MTDTSLAAPTPRPVTPDSPAGEWMLGASSFNWTPDIVDSHRTALDIVSTAASGSGAAHLELEPGSVWRTFPTPTDAEVDALREKLAGSGSGSGISIVGLSLDDFEPGGRPRTHDERLAFLLPQVRAAHRVGASGVRLPIGRAGRALLVDLQRTLHELSLTLYEEAQGLQNPSDPSTAAAIEVIAELGDPSIRLLIDISMLMPALPVSYLSGLESGGLPGDLLARLTDEWRDPATLDAVRHYLGSGAVPGPLHTLYMNMLVRFGRSDASVLGGILPLVGAIHLKFWDLDDSDGRVSTPIADLSALLATSGFAGTLTSEWGGHEWLDGWDATETTRAHLALARRALGLHG